MEELKKYKKDLDEIFYSHDFLMKSYPKLLEEIKKNGLYIPASITKFYYDNQAITQIFKPVRKVKTKNEFPIITDKPFKRIYCDSMYLKLSNSTNAFVCIMDLFSKFAFVKMTRIGKRAQNVPSSFALQCFEEFEKEVDKLGYKIETCFTDLGNEYRGEFQEYLEDKNIEQVVVDAGNKKAMSPIERFNGTLRISLEKYRFIHGQINNDSLKSIVDSYNNSKHGATNKTPIEILSNNNYDDVKEQYLDKLKTYSKVNPVEGYVRILTNDSLFKSAGANWSVEIYKIKKFIPAKNRYVLEEFPNDFFSINEIQPINKEYLMHPKVRIEREEVETVDEEEVKNEPRQARERKVNNKFKQIELDSTGKKYIFV